MIALIRMESYKLWHKRQFQGLVLIILLVNLGLLLYTQQNQTIPIHAYDKLQKELSTIPNDERYDWISTYDEKIQAFSVLQQIQNLQMQKPDNWENMIASLRFKYPGIEDTYGEAFLQEQSYYTGSLEQEAVFMRKIQKEMDTLHDIPARQKEIQDKADSIRSVSIFSKEHSFSSKNITKTADDFQKMEDVPITYQLEKGLHEALSFPITSFFIIVMMLSIAASMIIDEKSRNLFSIVRSCKNGKSKTIMAKCFVMVSSIGLFSTILTVSNLCVMNQLCNLGDLNASLISLASYAEYTYPITILQYLFLFLVTKWIAASCIGTLMLLISIISRHKITCFTGILAFLGFQLICYTMIPDNSTLTIGKYLNFISFLQTDVLFRTYLNLNIAGHAVSLQNASALCLLVFLVIFLIGSCILYSKKQNLQIEAWKLPQSIARFLPDSKRILPYLWIQESFQLFIIQKGLLFLLCFFCLQSYTYHNKYLYVSQDEKSWMQYMNVLEGKPNKEKDEFLDAQQKTYDDLHVQLDEINQKYENHQITRPQKEQMESIVTSQLYGEPFFQKLHSQYNEIKQKEHREMITPFGYELLLFQDSMTLVPAILALLFLLLSLSNIQCVSYQNSMNRVLYATPKGRSSLLFHKLAIALFCGIIYSILAFAFDFALVYQTYGFPSLQASIISMNQFAHMPAIISISGFLCLNYFIRLFAIESSICVLFALSAACKHQLHVLFLLCLVVIIPLLLPLMGIHYLDAFSLYPLFQNATYFSEQQTTTLLCSFLWYLAIGIGSIYYTKKQIK